MNSLIPYSSAQGVFHSPYAKSAGKMDGEINKYLYSILSPLDCLVGVPDLNLTTSITKAISITSNVEVLFNVPILFQFLFHTPYSRGMIRQYVYDNATSKFNFLQTIQPEQDLAQNFRRARFVSGCASLISNTVASGSYAVNGQLNAIGYQDAPNVRDLTYDTVLQYKETHGLLWPIRGLQMGSW
jgi:hypothetical protein